MVKKTTRKTTGKKAPPFQKGNKIGRQFQPGNPGGPGRPPNIGSPRAMLQRYAETVAPKKIRKRLRALMPELDVASLSWAEVVALTHLLKSATGDVKAILATYKQIDDEGAEKIDDARATVDLLRRLRERANGKQE